MLFKSRRNEYADTDGPVRYLDDSGLRRPLDMPRPQIAIMFAFVLVAALIGGYLLFNVLDAVRGGTARAQASVEENLSREVSYDLPALTSYITLNDDEIKQAVADAGLTVIDKGGMSDDPEAALELIKLPSDVSELDAGLMYNKGVSKLSASEAALLLNGSWTLDADRSDGTSMRLRYADFSSGSLDAAIDAAIAAGIDRERIIVDPGIGFSKTTEHNWQLIDAVDAFQDGFKDLRVLWGVSRKRFLGELLADNGQDRPALERDASTMALSTYLALHRAWCVRTHEVRANRDAMETVARLLA